MLKFWRGWRVLFGSRPFQFPEWEFQGGFLASTTVERLRMGRWAGSTGRRRRLLRLPAPPDSHKDLVSCERGRATGTLRTPYSRPVLSSVRRPRGWGPGGPGVFRRTVRDVTGEEGETRVSPLPHLSGLFRGEP